MPKQPEQILEEQLVTQLQKLGYSLVLIKDEKELIANLKSQLEKHNNIQFSNKEFEKVLNILSKGSVFEKSKTLREKQHIVSDNGEDGEKYSNSSYSHKTPERFQRFFLYDPKR